MLEDTSTSFELDKLPLELRDIIYCFVFYESGGGSSSRPQHSNGPDQIHIIADFALESCAQFKGDAQFLSLADPVILGDMHDVLKATAFVISSSFQGTYLRSWCSQGGVHALVRKLRIDNFPFFVQRVLTKGGRTRTPELMCLISELPTLEEVEVDIVDMELNLWLMWTDHPVDLLEVMWTHTKLGDVVDSIGVEEPMRILRITGGNIESMRQRRVWLDDFDSHRTLLHKLRDA